MPVENINVEDENIFNRDHGGKRHGSWKSRGLTATRQVQVHTSEGSFFCTTTMSSDNESGDHSEFFQCILNASGNSKKAV